MENKEAIGIALTEFMSRLREATIPDVLLEYLRQVGRTGVTMFPWTMVKPLIVAKLYEVLQEVGSNYFKAYQPSPYYSNTVNVSMVDCTSKIIAALQRFQGIPFTIQRICELLMDPYKHYKRWDNLLRALEKVVYVVRTVDPSGKKEEPFPDATRRYTRARRRRDNRGTSKESGSSRSTGRGARPSATVTSQDVGSPADQAAAASSDDGDEATAVYSDISPATSPVGGGIDDEEWKGEEERGTRAKQEMAKDCGGSVDRRDLSLFMDDFAGGHGRVAPVVRSLPSPDFQNLWSEYQSLEGGRRLNSSESPEDHKNTKSPEGSVKSKSESPKGSLKTKSGSSEGSVKSSSGSHESSVQSKSGSPEGSNKSWSPGSNKSKSRSPKIRSELGSPESSEKRYTGSPTSNKPGTTGAIQSSLGSPEDSSMDKSFGSSDSTDSADETPALDVSLPFEPEDTPLEEMIERSPEFVSQTDSPPNSEVMCSLPVSSPEPGDSLSLVKVPALTDTTEVGAEIEVFKTSSSLPEISAPKTTSPSSSASLEASTTSDSELESSSQNLPETSTQGGVDSGESSTTPLDES